MNFQDHIHMASLALIICIKHKKINPDNIVVGIVPGDGSYFPAVPPAGLDLRLRELQN